MSVSLSWPLPNVGWFPPLWPPPDPLPQSPGLFNQIIPVDPFTSNGVDPVLGFPYPPVDYELFAPANGVIKNFTTDTINLTWTVPTFNASPTNYRIYNVSGEPLYYWKRSNPIFAGTPTLVNPGSHSSESLTLNTLWLWMSNVPSGIPPLIIGPQSGPNQTIGTLIVGKWYKIIKYNGSDDFTNIQDPMGQTGNATGTTFFTTGTTPHIWTFGSELSIQIAAQTWPSPMQAVIMWNGATLQFKVPESGIDHFELYRIPSLSNGVVDFAPVNTNIPPSVVVNGIGSFADSNPRDAGRAAVFYKLVGVTSPSLLTFPYNIVYVSAAQPLTGPNDGTTTHLNWGPLPNVSWFPSLS